MRKKASGNASNLILVGVYIINISLLVSFAFRHFSDDFQNIGGGVFFLAISGLIVSFLLFKWLTTAFIGWLFDYEEVASDLLFQRFLVHSVLGFVLFPVAIFVGFYPGLKQFVSYTWALQLSSCFSLPDWFD